MVRVVRGKGGLVFSKFASGKAGSLVISVGVRDSYIVDIPDRYDQASIS